MLIIKWGLVVVLGIHGLIHLLGGFSELRIAKFNNLSGQTLFELNAQWRRVLGIGWLVVVGLFLLAAVGLAFNLAWAKPLAALAAVLSQILVVVWWPDAKFGTIANAVILLGLYFLI